MTMLTICVSARGIEEKTPEEMDQWFQDVGYYSYKGEKKTCSYPAVSPVFSNGKSYLSWLQTELPQQVESERYRIMISDPNGENAHIVYPAQGSSGYITPQHLTWAPGSSEESAWIAFLTDGNIWLVNPFSGVSNQITSDGTITKFIWE